MPKSVKVTPAPRETALRRMLTTRRRELVDDIRQRVRSHRSADQDIRDALEQTDADTQNDMALARLQSQAATLARVEEALARMTDGSYGTCSACRGDIPQARLRALPFAVRCQACESDRERRSGSRVRTLNGRTSSLFGDPAGP